MDGEFTCTNKSGQIIYASSPGMKSPYESRASKTPASASKGRPMKSLIAIFNDLSTSDTDPEWVEKFNKMSVYKFPSKFSWVASSDPEFYGTLFYKNRQINKSLALPVDWDIEDLRHEVKKFLLSYASSSTEDEDLVYQTKPPDMAPVPWKSLKVREQEELIEKYVTGYALEHGLDKDQSQRLGTYILLYSVNKDLGSRIEYDGSIVHIHGIYKDPETGYYKIK